LRLHPDEALDDRDRREPLPLQQELARQRRAIQLAQGEDALGHASTLQNPSVRVGMAPKPTRSKRPVQPSDAAVVASRSSSLF
jgi:hypothetical protein